MNQEEEESVPFKTVKVMKIIVVGFMASGKTSIIRRYVNGSFSEFYKGTIGIDFAHKKFDWSDDLTIDLQLWDIAGQEQSGKVTHMYYQQAVGAMIVFDLSRQGGTDADGKQVPNTLEIANEWKKDIDEKVMTTERIPIPCLLVGNKSDLGVSQKSKEEIDNFCNDNGFIGYIETSAKNNVNIQDSVNFLLNYIINNNIEPEAIDNSKAVSINGVPNKNEKHGCC